MSTSSSRSALEFDQLTKRFGEHVAVDAMTFSVPRGSIFGFLGPNGAGKTTTIGMALGLIPPSSGTARVLGFDIRTNPSEVLQNVGAMVERPAFYPYLSGRMNLQVFGAQAGMDDRSRIEEIIDLVGMSERANAKFGGYSTGMKQRIGIGAALLCDPELVILDEPTNGLDPAGQREIRELVRRLSETGHTVFVSSHILAEIQEVCSHVAIINRGKLVSTGPMSEILAGTDQLVIDVDRPEDARQTLLNIPDLEKVVVDERQRLIVDVSLDRAPEINQTLVQSGFAVSQLRHQEGQLEERFLALTGQATGSEQTNG
ncbi:MAG: ABC transporter ATP-binding protein [Sphaerobacteraceae bacterium]|nr:MAG: ABC transporter ATP-binding protein [Sphaerobacteraceae bacterium]